MRHNELKKKALQNQEVQAAYEALESEFVLLRQEAELRPLQGSDDTSGSLAAPSPDEVRDKLEALQIMEEDIADAVTWARDSLR